MQDLISRQAAIDTLDKHLRTTDVPVSYPGIISALTEWLNELPSAQPEMIREIRKWINSGNRGNADYFIVEKIEEIINKYE